MADLSEKLRDIGEHSRVLVITSDPAADLAALRTGLGGADLTALPPDRLRDFVPARPFDAVISPHGLEHLARPGRLTRAANLPALRTLFSSTHEWTVPGAWFALRTNTANRLPRRSEALSRLARDLPGVRCWRVEEIVMASGATWELREIDTHRVQRWPFAEGYLCSTSIALRRVDL
jgi:hypothetical protein